MTDPNRPENEEEMRAWLTDADDELLLENGGRLSELWIRYATVMAHREPANEWEGFARGILGRSNYTFQTILSISQREVDSAVLTRVLYEHAVCFAWVAIDPGTHILMLEKYLLTEHRKAATDLSGVGANVPDPEALELRFSLRDVPLVGITAAPATQNRAEAADKYWLTRLGESSGFRRAYPSIFRHYSMYMHPTHAGIAPFSLLADGKPKIERKGAAAVDAVSIFWTELRIAALALGWPSKDEVEDAFTHGFVGSKK